MGLRIDYLRSILGSMGRRDFIDVSASGKIELVEKGWKALGKASPSPYGGMLPSGPAEPPEVRYKNWLEGKVSQKKKKEEEKKKKEEEELDGPTLLKRWSSEKLSPEQKLMKWTGQ